MQTGARAGPWRITFVTSPDECNRACFMCRDHSPLARRTPAAPRRLAFEVVERVLDERRGSPLREVVASTRGEPLLWPHLPRLAETCRERGLGLNVTTNGSFPGGAERWARRLAPACSDVKISWLAATPATAEALSPGRSLERDVEGVRTFLRVRDALRAAGARACRVSFQVTAEERNVAELPGIVRLAAELGIDRVKVNHLQVHFPELSRHDLRRSPASRARWNAAVDAMRAEAGAAPRAGRAPPALQNVERWERDPARIPHGPCPFLGRELWLSVDGELEPCPSPSATGGRLVGPRSIRDTTVGAFWADPSYLALRDGYASRAECARCAFRRPGGV